MRVDEQTIKDLEFDVVRGFLANYCKSEKAKANALRISPFKEVALAEKEFAVLKEIQQVYYRDDLSFPHASSQDIDYALKLLNIENGVLVVEELVRIFKLCLGTDALIRFAKKYKDEFPNVFESCAHIDSVDRILKIIKSVLNKHLEIDDKASNELEKIRNQLKSTKIEIDKNFEVALRSYRKEAVLDNTEETFLDNRRLLTVISAQKKKVSGKIVGVSSKGNLSYIEPSVNIKLNKMMDQLVLDETNEIFKILQVITFELRDEKRNLQAFERLLTRFDLYNAKVILAKDYNGIIPKLSNQKSFYWENALHPILLRKNTEIGRETIGQDFELNKNQRFLVISGPNAGGKSITLKTVGLLQLMFQSGLFVPVKDVSVFCWFEHLLSDIGDNQSIDNQLSTYSYRLSRMQYFLQCLNKDSLVLLDEFGSGSDPELGGALAEVFYEEMYDKDCYAVINTHYTNIKILTSKKEQAVNAFMLFDTENLKPLYKLSVGQPGSSFTFEVARINGISEDLIARAQSKVSENKVNLDQLAIDLQKEKSDYNKGNKLQNKATQKSNELITKYEAKLNDLYDKTNQQRRFFEQQSKYTNVGRKIFDLIGKHKNDETNKELNLSIKKYVAIEKSRALEKKDAPVLDKKLKAVIIEKPTRVKREVTPVNEPAKKIIPAKVGSRVKIAGYDKTGIILKLKNEIAEVVMGNFKVKVKIKSLEVFT